VTQIDIASAAPSGGVRCTPVPTWIEHRPHGMPTDASADRYIDDGACRLLQDTQVNLCLPGGASHFRSIVRVVTRSGAEKVSHYVVEFDPNYETVEVHVVRIRRGDEIIDYAQADRFQTFRRETNLERLALNGRLTASLLIPDVRIGDIVETAATVYGRNPALGDKFAGWIAFDDVHPWFRSDYRCLRPVGRIISARPFNEPPALQSTVKGDVEEVRCTFEGQAGREIEDLGLPWLLQGPTAQFSEFRSWTEVAQLFAPYYATVDLPGSLEAEVDRIRDAHPNPSDRAAEWLRFVQRELRYFALALGEGGYVPRPLGEVWANRFGDCKDAAQLYVAGARRMGLDACAALTSTTHGRGLADFLPSSILFNHCIVRLRLDGAVYWLDPTMSAQGGNLATIFQPHAGWALALSGADDRLESMGDDHAPVHYLNLEEEIEFGPKAGDTARVTHQFEHYAWAADQMRNLLADGGSGAYARDKLKEVQALWPHAREVGSIAVRDDPVDNCLITTLQYELPDCWTPLPDKRLQFDVQDSLIASHLAPMKGAHRKSDIYLARPRKVSHRIHLKMPRRWPCNGWIRDDEAPSLAFVNRLKIEGRSLVHERSLTVSAWSLPAGNAKDYERIIDAARHNVLSIWAHQRFGRIRSPGWNGFGFNLTTLWVIFIALVLMGWFAKVLQKASEIEP
jgi:transglutaminase-like putative cysteine protease